MATAAAQQRERDDRPLYAYKLRDGEYEQVKERVCAQMPGVLRGQANRRFAPMFCVYAAETFRRRHTGGPWKWETVFDEIGRALPPYQAIYAWVAEGLQHFKRPLLRSRHGDREFLLTLACEGGLPLRLLHNENAHLSRYCRALLTAYHRDRHRPDGDATDIARQVAARYLPTFLRHEVVFNRKKNLQQDLVAGLRSFSWLHSQKSVRSIREGWQAPCGTGWCHSWSGWRGMSSGRKAHKYHTL
mgnify:CR=1 FL=1